MRDGKGPVPRKVACGVLVAAAALAVPGTGSEFIAAVVPWGLSGRTTAPESGQQSLCTAPAPVGNHPVERAAVQASPPTISILGGVVVVLEYDSVYAVHNAPDPSVPLRQQYGAFDLDRILPDLALVVDPTVFDFVLMYSVREVPGWIHSGALGSVSAKNIGWPNSLYGSTPPYRPWVRLRQAPHMNSVDFVDSFGPLTAFHEIGHHWNVYWARSSPGPRGWRPGDPVAWLAGAGAHWSWNWYEVGMPGLMYSGPTSDRFNAFDLYGMGLMGYQEARQYVHQIYEDPNPGPSLPSPLILHNVALNDLVSALSLEGSAYFEGDGHRMPDTDPSARQMNVLMTIIKGRDEVLTPAQQARMIGLASELGPGWSVATWGRSSLTPRAGPLADLAIATHDSGPAKDGATLGYDVVASNTGPDAVPGALVTDTLPPELTGPTWICAATAGSVCPASGTGNISASITLAPGGSATFTISGTAAVGSVRQIVNTAGVAVPSGFFDPNPLNDTAFVTTPVYRILAFYTLPPCRVIDTRTSDPPSLTAADSRTFSLPGKCGVPSSAWAVSANVTVTQPTDRGNLRFFPGGTPAPLASAVNYAAGQTRANNAILPLSAAGQVSVRCSQSSGSVHLVVDVNGYFQ
jgi:uncharacterized repeat protein (TIGR01451 family)